MLMLNRLESFKRIEKESDGFVEPGLRRFKILKPMSDPYKGELKKLIN